MAPGRLMPMIDDFAKEHLHDHLRWVREALVWKLDGLCEYDIRRPLTSTGTNLLGLVKHLAIWESRYFGEVFARPFPEPLPRWDDEAADDADVLGRRARDPRRDHRPLPARVAALGRDDRRPPHRRPRLRALVATTT